MPNATPPDPLQALAEQLCEAYPRMHTEAATVNALRGLLPSIRYLSLASVWQRRSQAGLLVGVENLASAGQAYVSSYLADETVPGRAIVRERPQVVFSSSCKLASLQQIVKSWDCGVTFCVPIIGDSEGVPGALLAGFATGHALSLRDVTVLKQLAENCACMFASASTRLYADLESLLPDLEARAAEDERARAEAQQQRRRAESSGVAVEQGGAQEQTVALPEQEERQAPAQQEQPADSCDLTQFQRMLRARQLPDAQKGGGSESVDAGSSSGDPGSSGYPGSPFVVAGDELVGGNGGAWGSWPWSESEEEEEGRGSACRYSLLQEPSSSDSGSGAGTPDSCHERDNANSTGSACAEPAFCGDRPGVAAGMASTCCSPTSSGLRRRRQIPPHDHPATGAQPPGCGTYEAASSNCGGSDLGSGSGVGKAGPPSLEVPEEGLSAHLLAPHWLLPLFCNPRVEARYRRWLETRTCNPELPSVNALVCFLDLLLAKVSDSLLRRVYLGRAVIHMVPLLLHLILRKRVPVRSESLLSLQQLLKMVLDGLVLRHMLAAGSSLLLACCATSLLLASLHCAMRWWPALVLHTSMLLLQLVGIVRLGHRHHMAPGWGGGTQGATQPVGSATAAAWPNGAGTPASLPSPMWQPAALGTDAGTNVVLTMQLMGLCTVCWVVGQLRMWVSDRRLRSEFVQESAARER